MAKLMNQIFSCIKATELIEKRNHCALDFMEELQLKIHILTCRGCTKYSKQSLFIDRFLKHYTNKTFSSIDSIQLEERIIKDLHL